MTPAPELPQALRERLEEIRTDDHNGMGVRYPAAWNDGALALYRAQLESPHECGHVVIMRDERGEVLVDVQDLPLVFGHRWSIKSDTHTSYVHSRYEKASRTYLLHRVIMGATSSQVVDHINGNGLDNRRCNLRLCPPIKNAWNSRHKPRGKTGFIGVRVTPTGSKYVAQITNYGEKIHIGSFDTAEEAARAYDKRCLELRGEFAVLNFPEGK